MVIGLLTIMSIPTVTGCAMAVSEQRKSNERKVDARRMAKVFIDAESGGETEEDSIVHGKRVVLRDNKVYLDDPDPAKRKFPSHTAQGFYIDYPEFDHLKHLKRGLGFATSIADDPPMLGWIYVDQDTHELKYGNRTQSFEHVVGPWEWEDEEKTITLEDKRVFVAVEEEEGIWAVYFDRDGDELEGVLEEQDMLDNAYAPILLKRNLVEEELIAKARAQILARVKAEQEERERTEKEGKTNGDTEEDANGELQEETQGDAQGDAQRETQGKTRKESQAEVKQQTKGETQEEEKEEAQGQTESGKQTEAKVEEETQPEAPQQSNKSSDS